jgi:hypothetical protein
VLRRKPIFDGDNGLTRVIDDPLQHRILHIRTAEHPAATMKMQIYPAWLRRCDYPQRDLVAVVPGGSRPESDGGDTKVEPWLMIQRAIWLYLRFTLSYRDVEELLAERGLDVSYETVRRWELKFGPLIARRLRRRRPRPSDQWHLEEMVVRIAGKRMYLWRAVDHEGEVLDMVQSRRDSRAALRLMRKLLRKQGFVPSLTKK